MLPVISYKNLAITYHLAQLGQDVARRLSPFELYCWPGVFVPDEILHFLSLKDLELTAPRVPKAADAALGANSVSARVGREMIRTLLWIFSAPRLYFSWRRCLVSWRNIVQAHRAVVIVALKQDVALAKLLISGLPRRHVVVVLSDWVVLKSPSTLRWLRESEIAHIVLPRDVETADLLTIFGGEPRKVLAIAESSLPDHSFSHRIQIAASSCGHDTAAIQHGFENVGLTYQPNAHPKVERVLFASGKIFVWQPLNRLPAWVPPDTRAKCIHVGPIKPPTSERAQMPPPAVLQPYERVIGVYENLHWERYSKEFRANFFHLVSALAVNYPRVCFLVRPHPAGQWSLVHWTGGFPANVIIANSNVPPWADMDVSDFLAFCSATLTTPSTVAVDSVLVGCPAIVYVGDLEADAYCFAELATGYTEVKEFLGKLSDPNGTGDVAEAQHIRLLNYFGGVPSGVNTVRQWLQD